MKHDQSWNCLAVQEELKLYCVYESLCAYVKQFFAGESCEKAHLTRGRYSCCGGTEFDISAAFVQLVSVPPASSPSAGKETRQSPSLSERFLSFSFYRKILLSSNCPSLFFITSGEARALVCVEVRGHVCVLQLLSVTLKGKLLHLGDILKTGISMLLQIERLM